MTLASRTLIAILTAGLLAGSAVTQEPAKPARPRLPPPQPVRPAGYARNSAPRRQRDRQRNHRLGKGLRARQMGSSRPADEVVSPFPYAHRCITVS